MLPLLTCFQKYEVKYRSMYLYFFLVKRRAKTIYPKILTCNFSISLNIAFAFVSCLLTKPIIFKCFSYLLSCLTLGLASTQLSKSLGATPLYWPQAWPWIVLCHILMRSCDVFLLITRCFWKTDSVWLHVLSTREICRAPTMYQRGTFAKYCVKIPWYNLRCCFIIMYKRRFV